MKIGSPVPHKKARIEIIPLIDIMFFLLAAFMMVSLSMIKLQSIKVDLPTATQAKRELKPDILNLAVDRDGDIFIEKERKTLAQAFDYISNKFHLNTNLPVYISGDRAASHGAVVAVLDLVRKAGIQKVAFAISPASEKQP